ncbi:uncharacterized protein LOC106767799 [Vigna radiata var. radiata]|uniref:Uncharacterized protein LOC106767799 n=1 Tax=Vigna radiata var. radiata TaxID=3916 RepID=A0A1S3UQ75_VIGRR|nr:uncharacterized protein LOC106767799 [Vigna radiata var. radiata]
MASAQCEQTHQHTSFGEKVSQFFKGHHSHSNELTHTTKTETKCRCTKTHTNTKTKTHETSKRPHNKGLLQNIRDRFSEHDGSTTSSSDSESDHENCKRKD